MLFMRDLTTRSRVLLLVTILTALVIAYNLKLTTGADAKPMRIATVAESVMPPNLLLAKWEGPYGGVPPFDRVKVADFKPALEAAMAENLAVPAVEDNIAVFDLSDHAKPVILVLEDPAGVVKRNVGQRGKHRLKPLRQSGGPPHA